MEQAEVAASEMVNEFEEKIKYAQNIITILQTRLNESIGQTVQLEATIIILKEDKEKLTKEIKINNIEIEDKSFLHKKHQNFSKDKFHIKLIIESSELKKIGSIEANRKIHGILRDEIGRSIHSLQIIIV